MSASHRFRSRILALATQRRILLSRRDFLRQAGTAVAGMATLPMLQGCDAGGVAMPAAVQEQPAYNGSLSPIAGAPPPPAASGSSSSSSGGSASSTSSSSSSGGSSGGSTGSSSGGSSSGSSTSSGGSSTSSGSTSSSSSSGGSTSSSSSSSGSSTSGSSSSGSSTSSSSGGSTVVPPPMAASFVHGVASGDPLTDRVVLWTRITTTAPQVKVDYLVSAFTNLGRPVASGSVVTSGLRDYTVKIDPTGLASYSTYYYQFSVTLADGTVVKSPVGRTKTAPKAGDTNRLRFIGASCQNYIYGFFNPYRAIAIKLDFDAILFLGDYIYEAGGTPVVPGRGHQPNGEIITLADYRTRFAQYRTDEDLQAAHRQFPFICVWDDHETANNSWVGGSDRHDPAIDGSWEQRKGAAIRAYFEWIPVRDNRDTTYDSADGEGYLATGNGSIVRSLRYGDLAEVLLLDTRLVGRAEPTDTVTVTPEHTLLGDEQRAWLLGRLSNSTARWKLVAQQVLFAPFKIVPLPEAQGGTYFLQDSWDGYRFDRNAVMQHLKTKALDNVVFLSGDSHSVTCWDLPIEPNDSASYDRLSGAGSLAVEYSTGAIANAGTLSDGFQANNPHLKYAENTNGYLILDITPERMQGEYWFTASPQVHQRAETFRRGYVNTHQRNRLTLTTTATTGRADAAPLAP